LKDKEGWFSFNQCNKSILEECSELLTGFVLGSVSSGDGWYKNDIAISVDEYEFFGVVVQEEEETPLPSGEHLWDGKSTLEVGMVVKYNEYDFPIEFISKEGTQVVLKGVLGLQVVLFKDLKAAAKSKKETTLDKALTAWQGKHLDYAYDTKSSTVPFGEVFDLIYDVMGGENK
jgi:hypothetical protein